MTNSRPRIRPKRGRRSADLLPRDVGHDLFAGRLHDEAALMAVLDAQQLGAVALEAAAFLPQFGRLHHRHRELDGTGAVHLLAHDRLDLADHAQAHRHVGVDARAELLDHAGAHHEPMARDLGIGRRFLEGGDKESGSFHRSRERVPGTGARASHERARNRSLAECNPAGIIDSVQKIGV
jgi:hypothetical protein